MRNHDGDVVVTYTLFADRADGTYSGIDPTHAHLSIPATFVWARGLEDCPVEVGFRVPEGSGWRVATRNVRGPTGPQTIRVAVHHEDSRAALERYTAGVRAVTAEEAGGGASIRHSTTAPTRSSRAILVMVRAGLISLHEFARQIGGGWLTRSRMDLAVRLRVPWR